MLQEISLTQCAARSLALHLQSKPGGFSIAELRRLDAIVRRIEAKTDAYQAALTAIDADARAFNLALARDGVSAADYQSRTEAFALQCQARHETIEATRGAELVTFRFEQADFDFIVQTWIATPAFPGNRASRTINLALADALDHPLAVDPDALPAPVAG